MGKRTSTGRSRGGDTSQRIYQVRKLHLPRSDLLDALASESGRLYSEVVVGFWRCVRRRGHWMSTAALMREHNSAILHAHSADAVAQQFGAALASWSARRGAPGARPPHRRKRYNKVAWKRAAISLRDGGAHLRLANGRGTEAVVVDWDPSFGEPVLVEVGWNHRAGCYELRSTTRLATPAPVEPEEADPTRVVGAYSGVVHPFAVTGADYTTIYSGGELRAKRRYRNMIHKRTQSKASRYKRGSKRHRRVMASMRAQMKTLDDQASDIEHKLSARAVADLADAGTQVLATGSAWGIRERHPSWKKMSGPVPDLDALRRDNQNLHQSSYERAYRQLAYKARRGGIFVAPPRGENPNIPTCPKCQHQHEPSGRVFTCPQCGFTAHRDGVGGWNYREKYLVGQRLPVVGAMASPTGVRWHPHLCCRRRSP